MKGITNWLVGYFRLSVTGGDPGWCLNRLTGRGIVFWDIQWTDEFTVSFSVPASLLNETKQAVTDAMCQVESVEERGMWQRYRGLKKRLFLLFFLLLTIVSCMVIPKFVWFYRVTGNDRVPEEKIIRQVQAAGVRVGCYGKKIQSAKIENAVLSNLPELSFLTINQSGGCAEIVVREKTLSDDINNRRVPQNIVAGKSGLITGISVLEGAALVKPGDMVEKGDVLISGLVDLEYKYRVCGASGDVLARTWTEKELLTPASCKRKTEESREIRVFYLCFGQKRIKITPGSRIYPDGCGKITKMYSLGLPGGLYLPVMMVEETYTFYDLRDTAVSEDEARMLLESAMMRQLQQDMLAGTVKELNCQMEEKGEYYFMYAAAETEEMIGRTVAAEIFKGDLQDDGTNDKRGAVGTAH